MSKDPYFTQYNSPNIVIVPTKLCDDPPQKPEPEADSKPSTDETNKIIPILIEGTSSNSCTDTNSCAKNKSWASNYLQCIGLSHETSIMNRRAKMNTNQDNGLFLTQDPPPAVVGAYQFTDVNMQAVAPNYQNASFPNYNNLASTSGVTPVTAYPGSYENNNYYYDQSMNAMKSGCCSTYYSSLENTPNIYSTYGQPSHVGNNTSSTVTYYNPDANLAPANFTPYPEFYSLPNNNKQICNYTGRQVNLPDNNKATSITPCQDKRCSTPLIDENLLSPHLGTSVNTNLSVTKLANVKSCNIEETTVSKEKKCDCTCSKRNSEIHDKQITEEISSVQANEKIFRDFLRKLKIDRSSKAEKKQPSSSSKSSGNSKKVKKSKIKLKDKSTVQENEKAFRKLLQKLKMDQTSESRVSQNKQIIKANISPKNKTSNDEQNTTSSDRKTSKDTKSKEEERPKFIKTKYVDKQEPEYMPPIKKTRLDSNNEQRKYSKTKITSTKYVDQQEYDYKPIKKSGIDGHEIRQYSATKSKSTKCVDKKERECKPVKKQKYESDYELKKYSNLKTMSTKYVQNEKQEYKQIKKTKIDNSSEFSNYKIKRSRDESDSSDKITKKYDSDYRIKTYKTESTKYYKNRMEDTHKHSSPVKSVVKISKTRETKMSPPYNILDKNDLRDKLSRKLPTKTKESKEEFIKTKSSEKSKDNNLIITVNNTISDDKMSPVKITEKLKTKTESSKKINLVINIVYREPGSRTESDKSDNGGLSPQENTDLSFLDDFNVDEIVASLNKSEKISTPQSNAFYAALGEGGSKKTGPSNYFIKSENSESEAQMILEKGDILNSLLSKEACILDSFRIIHEQNEDRSYLNNDQNKSASESQNKLSSLRDNSIVEDQSKQEVKNETVFDQSNSQNVLLDKSVISKLTDSEKGVIKEIHEPTKNSTGKTCAVRKKSEVNSNNMHTYEYDIISFDEEDKRRQLELLKILQDTKDGEIETIQTHNTPSTVQAAPVTIIDLSSDDSNESSYQTEEKEIDDVYVLEENSNKNIETIDLTTTKELSKQILTPSLKATEVLKNKDNKTVSSNINVKEDILVNKYNMAVAERDILSNDKNIEKYVSVKNDSNINIKKDNLGTEYNMTVAERDILSNDKNIENDVSIKNVLVNQSIVRDKGVCLDNNESKATVTDKDSLGINATNDYLKTNKNFNRIDGKLNEDAMIELPAVNTIKETLDTPNNVKDTVSNIQNDINESQSQSQLSVEKESISIEYQNIDGEIKKVENCITTNKYESIASNGDKEGKHENKKDHIKLKEATKDLPQNINSNNVTISKLSNYDKTEQTSLQAKGEVKNEKKSSTNINENDNKQEDDKKVIPELAETKTKVNIDEKTNTNENDKSPKVKVQNKTEASTPMPSISGTKTNNPSPPIAKDKPNLKTVDMKFENVNKKMKSLLTVNKEQKIAILSEKIDKEMYKCFKQKYTAQGLIHSGSFSKVFHFTSFSGRDYAVKSYTDWQSVYKYAEKKDMLISLQHGLARNAYGCVYLINTFSLHGHLCLLMDYYPKNLKQAMEEHGKPFHINAVQYLARQLVSAVMLLKSHDVVHLDIKPTHILLSHNNDRLKLCGLDSARYISKIPMLPNLGTPNYRPPEVIIGYKIGFDVDVWATGLVMYEMATDVKLFPGVQNNDILFKQMCTLGPLPVEMLHRSHFSPTHFTGSSFKRVMANKQNKINIITKFYKTKRLEKTIIKAYNISWRSFVSQEALVADKKRVLSFAALLREMLEVNPGDRMPIQFVYSHAFFTEVY